MVINMNIVINMVVVSLKADHYCANTTPRGLSIYCR